MHGLSKLLLKLAAFNEFHLYLGKGNKPSKGLSVCLMSLGITSSHKIGKCKEMSRFKTLRSYIKSNKLDSAIKYPIVLHPLPETKVKSPCGSLIDLPFKKCIPYTEHKLSNCFPNIFVSLS
jgi:hypothetical protein